MSIISDKLTRGTGLWLTYTPETEAPTDVYWVDASAQPAFHFFEHAYFPEPHAETVAEMDKALTSNGALDFTFRGLAR